uniref:THAP-type domain-containing protein n=1 Tax=Parascaris univalens TaxID=6257 RepID=A0A915BH31_PARUN
CRQSTCSTTMDIIERNCGETEAVHKFIAAVRSHPSIWRRCGGEPIEDEAANDCGDFQEVINELGWEDKVSVENARNAWRSLWTQYNSAKANLEQCVSSTWQFFDDMKFVDRSEMTSCAIRNCPSTAGSEIDGRPIAFFEAPSELDPTIRDEWIGAVPALSDPSSNKNVKVCELHFVKGAPCEDSPVPVLRLQNETTEQSRVSRKRKASRSRSPEEKSPKVESLDSVLQAVADSAIKREMELLGETDATEPLRLPSNSVAETTAESPAAGKAKIVRVSMKALTPLASGKFSSSYKIVRASGGVTAEASKLVLNGKGCKTKVFKVIKTSAGVPPVLKKVSDTISDVPKTKTIEEALSSLIANAPSLSEVDGTAIDQQKKLHSDAPSTSSGSSHIEALPSADMSKYDDDGTSTCPSTSTSSQIVDSADSQPLTLMSVLQQCLGPSSNFKDIDPLQNSQLRSDVPSFDSAKDGPGSTCIKCANDLPVLRRSLGRLESRVDSMIAMVRTLCARQATIEASRKQILSNAISTYKNPPIVVRPRSIPGSASGVTVKSCISKEQRSALTIGSSGTTSGSNTPTLSGKCGTMATLVRVKSSSGSTFKIVRAQPKLLVGPKTQNPVGTGKVNQVAVKSQLIGSESRKNLSSAVSNTKRNVTLDSDSSRPCLKAVVTKKEILSRDSSPDSTPPSLSTRFTPAPKQPDRSLTYLHKAVIRALLLFQGPFFTIGDFRLKGPAVVRTVGKDKLRECLAKLLDDGLLRRIDDHLDLTDPEAAFEKERLKSKLSKLTEYGITKEQYENNLEQIHENAELVVNR